MLLSQHVIHEKIINKTLTFHGLYEILETELAFDTTHLNLDHLPLKDSEAAHGLRHGSAGKGTGQVRGPEFDP